MTTAEKLEQSGFKKEVAGKNFDLIVNAFDHITADKTTGLVIQGGVGTGKTMSVKILFPECARSVNLTNQASVYDLRPKKETDDDGKEYFIWGFLDGMTLLDDIGNERNINDYGKPIDAAGDFIIHWHTMFVCRKAFEGRLVITTNLDDGQLIERYGQRVYDRLKEMCCFVKFTGDSNRKVQKVFK